VISALISQEPDQQAIPHPDLARLHRARQSSKSSVIHARRGLITSQYSIYYTKTR
jgi:hypothetical protein